MKAERGMSGARTDQKMRVWMVMKATWAGEGQRLVGVGWVVRGFLESEVQGMEGVEWNGGESILAEVRGQREFLLHGCGGTGKYQSEKPPEKKQQHEPTSRLSTISSFYLGSRSQPTPISLVSIAIRGLFCMDIKYFSLSSNSLF